VQVVDDGCGMSPADAARCFDRHATSKIRSMDDLEHIRTLGFRGEALASIGAVAQVELKTKRVEDDVGTLVKMEGGTEAERRPCATTAGTSIAVRNLFYNVPARRNFLKTPATELKHLTETFQFLALSNPDVAFRLVHNGNEHYDLPAARAGDAHDALRPRILGLLGDAAAEDLVPVHLDTANATVHGFVGTPSFHRSSRSAQFLFVNDRYVRDRYLSHAIKKAYGELLPDKAFPFFALFLDLDPRRVDVNVHPTKAEVKFDDQSGLYGVLREAVQKALARATVTPQFDAAASASDTSGTASGNASEETSGGTPASDAASSGRRQASKTRPSRSSAPRSFQPRGVESGDGTSSSPSSSPSAQPSSAGSSRRRARTSSGGSSVSPGEQSEVLYRPPEDDATGAEAASLEDAIANGPIWSLHDRYLLVPVSEGLLLVDPRAAHLRVRYEHALERLRDASGETQTLLFPETVELSPSEAEQLEALQPALQALGFDVGMLSGRTVALRGVPAHLAPDDAGAEALRALLASGDDLSGPDAARREQIAQTVARQGALDAGQPLAEDERRRLLQDLLACEMPYADPSGRPTLTTLSMEELAERLKG
jgi:DNA mismatch repair protein MutL